MTALRTIAALAGASVIFLGMASGASAYQCKKIGVMANASATAQAAALAGAQVAWTGKVKSSYGLSWSLWSIASGKTQSCSASGNVYTCQVRAKPCNYVVQ